MPRDGLILTVLHDMSSVDDAACLRTFSNCNFMYRDHCGGCVRSR